MMLDNNGYIILDEHELDLHHFFRYIDVLQCFKALPQRPMKILPLKKIKDQGLAHFKADPVLKLMKLL